MRFYTLVDPTKLIGDQSLEPVYVSDDESLKKNTHNPESIQLHEFLTMYDNLYQIQNGISEIMKATHP